MSNKNKLKVISGNKKATRWDAALVYVGLKEASLAVRANKRLMGGITSSRMAQKVVGRVSSKKFNEMMSKAVAAYNEDHKDKIFNE